MINYSESITLSMQFIIYQLDYQVIVQIPAKRAKLINTYGIPNIRGNQKYPARFKSSFQMPDCTEVIDNYAVKPSNARNCCIQTGNDDGMRITADQAIDCYPAGVEVNHSGEICVDGEYKCFAFVRLGLQKRMFESNVRCISFKTRQERCKR